MRARARAQADRLPDVQRAAVGVAEDVDAGVLGERRRGPGAGRRAAARRRALRRPCARRAAAASSATASPTVAACAQSAAKSAQNTRAQVSASGSARCDGLDLDAERVGERGEPAAALQRREPARERDRAQHRRVRPVERGARERLAQDAEVEARVVRDEHAARAACSRELGQDAPRRRRGVDHRLRDAGEALDAAAERL